MIPSFGLWLWRLNRKEGWNTTARDGHAEGSESSGRGHRVQYCGFVPFVVAGLSLLPSEENISTFPNRCVRTCPACRPRTQDSRMQASGVGTKLVA